MVHRGGQPMVDIHCHLLPGLDDGAPSLEVSLEMARMAVQDGIGTIIVTPHQLGNFAHNAGHTIRTAVTRMQAELQRHDIPLKLCPGADVRIEDDMVQRILADEVVTLGDHRRHVLLELPHELYVPLQPLLTQLQRHGLQGILSHPERNLGLLRQKDLVIELVDAGCLMQITAGSLLGNFGAESQQFCRWMLRRGLTHFVASDAHGIQRRRPRLSEAYDAVVDLIDHRTADELLVNQPRAVALGQPVKSGRRDVLRRSRWFGWLKAS